MSTFSSTHEQQTVAYEIYIRDNWDRLTPFEQEQARAYMQSKFYAGATAARAPEPPGWTVPVGYVSAFVSILFLPIVFAPLAFGLGIYNGAKGRTGHGIAQIALSIICGFLGMVIGFMMFASM